jgi:hypothetical protein
MSQKTGPRLKNTVVIIQYSDTSIDLASLMDVIKLLTASQGWGGGGHVDKAYVNLKF